MRKINKLTWKIEPAASEFGINPRTLTNRIRTLGIEPDSKGCFTTQQICAAVFGDMDGEKLRLVREQADKLARENKEAAGELINVVVLSANMQRFFSAARQRILSNIKLEDEEKDKILSELGQCLESVGKPSGANAKAAAEV